ncbi:NAD(P)H-hydrate dehydratase [Adlercreutzia caecimuris]|uniref:ADP-dependent (S)-NAD(P)H-hydrate dehydratase n=1 Tax=Adlercreutzia caecimuris TaxID=671266 RepID=A0A4S4FZF3_9ACTN|nr:NAD(P)H-hydrate dehydratase [Adlercreutzia caecimuris]THG36510.1 NAD(P)H-hydrate dehydratase [Adlercreutzia caecimuris]
MRSPTDPASAPNTAGTPLPSRDNAALAALAPWPDPQANKYTRGKLSLVAGAAAYPGAACLAGAAAERAGAGYTEVFCAGESLLAVRSFRPSLVARDWREWHPARQEARRSDRTGACVIGCGFDGDARQRELVAETVRAATGPVLIDGGALGLMADKAGQRLARERAERGVGPLVLTPHGGEAARLARGAELEGALGGPELACALARAYRALIVLKGPITFIADAEGIVETMDRGTAALAKAGTGDVLAGIIGALLAQGLAPRDAAALGCALHAEAGQAAAQELTEICVSAEDVIASLPQAVRAIVGAH